METNDLSTSLSVSDLTKSELVCIKGGAYDIWYILGWLAGSQARAYVEYPDTMYYAMVLGH